MVIRRTSGEMSARPVEAHMYALTTLLLLTLAGCGDDTSAPADELKRAIPVRVATVASTDLVRSLKLGGVATAGRSARLAPVGQGRIESIDVSLGDPVVRGQRLVQLDVSTLSLQRVQAETAVTLAKLQQQDASRKMYNRAVSNQGANRNI